MTRRESKPLPEKLTRLRSELGAIRARSNELTGRRAKLIEERRKLQIERQSIANQRPEYGVTDAKERRTRELSAVDAEIETITDQIDRLSARIEPLRSDQQAIGRTVNALHRHLGIDDQDEFIRQNYRVNA